MRLAFLTLLLGVLVGFGARSFLVDHPQWFSAFGCASTPAPKVIRLPGAKAGKPRVYPPSETTLEQLRRQFEDAVVVVLADESYDVPHKLVRVSVVEVWKGPDTLVGKTMDTQLSPPLSYLHAAGTERVLKFMRMTPHVDSASTVHFDGEKLRMNPALTVGTLKEVLAPTSERAKPTGT